MDNLKKNLERGMNRIGDVIMKDLTPWLVWLVQVGGINGV